MASPIFLVPYLPKIFLDVPKNINSGQGVHLLLFFKLWYFKVRAFISDKRTYEHTYVHTDGRTDIVISRGCIAPNNNLAI